MSRFWRIIRIMISINITTTTAKMQLFQSYDLWREVGKLTFEKFHRSWNILKNKGVRPTRAVAQIG